MNLEPIRDVFRPFFGLEPRETTTRFLYAILIGSLIVELIMIVLRLFNGATLSNSFTVRTLVGFMLSQLILLWAVKRGHIRLAAFLLVGFSWIGISYQAWNADGVRDVAIYLYILLIFIAALLSNWHFTIFLSLLSIIAIWFFAISEAMGLRTPHTDSPLRIARDLTAIFALLVLFLYLVIDTLRSSLDAVRQNEEKFRTIFNVSPVAIAIASLEDGRLLNANQAYWDLTGLDRAAAIGRKVIEFGNSNSASERAKFLQELKQKKSLHHPAYQIQSSSGGSRTALAFYELIDFEHEPAAMAMFYDITERENAQLALQESEQKYRNFVEQSMEGIWFLAFDQPIPTNLPPEEQVQLIYKYGYISDCNDVLANMYGYASSAEFRGTRLLQLSGGEPINEMNVKATLQLVREGYRSGNRETMEQTRQGKTVYFLNNAVGVIEDGCLVRLWGTQLDITALKSTEDALRLSEARTRALLDALPDMIFEFKSDGTILQFISSPTSRPLIPPEQFLGRTITEVLPSSVADQTMFAIERVLESGHVHAFEYQLVQDGENKTFEARITRLSTDTVLAVVRDVSLQKWILGERELLINELELKNAELERFAYTASHDLKSPLITIKGFLGYLREDTKSGNLKRLETDIQRISDAADKMQLLLNDLLELSRVGRMVHKPEPVDLTQMIREVLELLHGRLSRGPLPIRVTVAENLPVIYGDRARLLEVWQNLIDNAAKFMGEQVEPHIEIGQVSRNKDGQLILFVRDNGIGIDPKFKDRIFGLFDKLDPRSEGTGIGLALVKRILEFHGGKIWVESEPGKGATFFFSLPEREVRA